MSNPKFLDILPKEQVSFRIDNELYLKLINYANAKGLNKTDAINEILTNFLDKRTLTNNYLDNITGLYFKIPLDLEIKKEFIENGQILNTSENSRIVGDDSITIKIKQIPNNLDIFTADGYHSTKDGVLHSGIDFIIVKDVLKKPTTILVNKLDIDLMDSLYCFYFEVTADNRTNVYLINPIEAINKLSSANNKITWDLLVSTMQQLEDLQKTNNDSYKKCMEELLNSKNYISNKSKMDIVEIHFLDIEMYFPAFDNDNIIIYSS